MNERLSAQTRLVLAAGLLCLTALAIAEDQEGSQILIQNVRIFDEVVFCDGRLDCREQDRADIDDGRKLG